MTVSIISRKWNQQDTKLWLRLLSWLDFTNSQFYMTTWQNQLFRSCNWLLSYYQYPTNITDIFTSLMRLACCCVRAVSRSLAILNLSCTAFFSSTNNDTYNITRTRTLHMKPQKMHSSSIHITTFFATATMFSTVLYIDDDFRNEFLRKIFAVLCVVCKGLNSKLEMHNYMKLHVAQSEDVFKSQLI